jgi:membrane-bound ClpP family serine protease
MLLLSIIALLLLGTFLLILEITIIPGTTVVGILGGLFVIGGIYWMYHDFGKTAGHYTLIAASALIPLSLYFAFKAKLWKPFTLNDTLEGKANTINESVKEGDTGITLSYLRPVGKIEINGLILEAETTGEVIEQDTPVIIFKILPNKIIVKPKK